MGAKWTEIEEERLRTGWAADESAATIADDLGRTPGAVAAKAGGLKLKRSNPVQSRPKTSDKVSMSVQMDREIWVQLPDRKRSEYCRDGAKLMLLLRNKGHKGTPAELFECFVVAA